MGISLIWHAHDNKIYLRQVSVNALPWNEKKQLFICINVILRANFPERNLYDAKYRRYNLMKLSLSEVSSGSYEDELDRTCGVLSRRLPWLDAVFVDHRADWSPARLERR